MYNSCLSEYWCRHISLWSHNMTSEWENLEKYGQTPVEGNPMQWGEVPCSVGSPSESTTEGESQWEEVPVLNVPVRGESQWERNPSKGEVPVRESPSLLRNLWHQWVTPIFNSTVCKFMLTDESWVRHERRVHPRRHPGHQHLGHGHLQSRSNSVDLRNVSKLHHTRSNVCHLQIAQDSSVWTSECEQCLVN